MVAENYKAGVTAMFLLGTALCSGFATYSLNKAEELRFGMQALADDFVAQPCSLCRKDRCTHSVRPDRWDVDKIYVEAPIPKPTPACNDSCTARVCSLAYGDRVRHKLRMQDSWDAIVTDIAPATSNQLPALEVKLYVRIGADNQAPYYGTAKHFDCELTHVP